LQDTDPNLSHLHTACQSEPSDEGVLHDSLLADNLIMVVPSRLKWTSPGGNFEILHSQSLQIYLHNTPTSEFNTCFLNCFFRLCS
jgi:hypothetical protein